MGVLGGVRQWLGKRRLAKIAELKNNINLEIIKLARKSDQYDNYYADLRRDPLANERILKIERAYINAVFNKYRRALTTLCYPEEIEKMKALFLERATLWYEFRAQGDDFPLEKLDRLIKLEEDAPQKAGQQVLWNMKLRLEVAQNNRLSIGDLEQNIAGQRMGENKGEFSLTELVERGGPEPTFHLR